MTIKVVLFIFSIIALLVFTALAIWKFYQASTVEVYYDEDYGLTKEQRLQKKNEAAELERIKRSGKKKIGILFSMLAAGMLAFTIFVPGNIHQVNTGEVAVVRTFGRVEGYREPGVSWDFYMTKDYIYYPTTVQECSLDSQAYSADTQYIGLTVEMQYKIDSDTVVAIERDFRGLSNLESKIKVVAIDEVKSVYSKYRATEVMEHRNEISSEIEAKVKNTIEANYPCKVVKVAVPNLDFSDTFEKSVEDALASKVAAEQAALKAESEAKKKEIEADAAAYTAKKEAEAEAYAIEQKALADKQKAQYEAEALLIAAKADAEKAKIEADAAEYQGQREAAIKLQALASVNGWTVVKYTEADGTSYNKLVKSDGTVVSDEELAAGVKNLLTSEYYSKWDGKLPVYMMDSSGVVTVIPTP